MDLCPSWQRNQGVILLFAVVVAVFFNLREPASGTDKRKLLLTWIRPQVTRKKNSAVEPTLLQVEMQSYIRSVLDMLIYLQPLGSTAAIAIKLN